MLSMHMIVCVRVCPSEDITPQTIVEVNYKHCGMNIQHLSNILNPYCIDSVH